MAKYTMLILFDSHFLEVLEASYPDSWLPETVIREKKRTFTLLKKRWRKTQTAKLLCFGNICMTHLIKEVRLNWTHWVCIIDEHSFANVWWVKSCGKISRVWICLQPATMTKVLSIFIHFRTQRWTAVVSTARTIPLIQDHTLQTLLFAYNHNNDHASVTSYHGLGYIAKQLYVWFALHYAIGWSYCHVSIALRSEKKTH